MNITIIKITNLDMSRVHATLEIRTIDICLRINCSPVELPSLQNSKYCRLNKYAVYYAPKHYLETAPTLTLNFTV